MPARTVRIPYPVFPQLQPGQQALPLHLSVGTRNAPQHVVAAYAVVDDIDYRRFSQYRWMAMWSRHTRSFYAVRHVRTNGKLVAIYLHREILGLPRSPGHRAALVGDHINRDTTLNTKANLRVATRSQNVANRGRNRNAKSRYANVKRCGKKFQGRISRNGTAAYFPSVASESHAAWQANLAVELLDGAATVRQSIPSDEQPTQEEQQHLRRAVEAKLKAKGMMQ